MSLLNGMGSAVGDDEEAALSDCEDDDLEAAPVILPVAGPAVAKPASYEESLKTALADLENERQARKAAEAAKSDLDVAAVRLKSYIHEVIRQRDEANRQRDEALRAKEDRIKQLDEALQLKEDVIKQRDDLMLQRDEILKQKDAARGEIEGVARILVTQAEKVTSMANGIKSFSGGLPRVPKTSGLAAIALGFSKRAEEVIDEVLRQREDALQRKTELHIQMEQRNFTVAIEVSQLEASITQLREEVGKKSSELERCQKLLAGKDSKIAEMDRAILDQIAKSKHEAEIMKERVDEVESRLQLVSSETAQNIECVVKAKQNLLEIFRLIQSASGSSEVDLVVSSQDEDSVHKGFLAKGQELVDLAGKLILLWKETQQKAEKDREDYESSVRILQDENNEIRLSMSSLTQGKTFIENSEPVSMDGVNDVRGHAQPEVPEWSSPTQGHALTEESGFSLPDEALTDKSGFSTKESGDDAFQDTAERFKTNGDLPRQQILSFYQETITAQETTMDQATKKISRLEGELENMRQELERVTESTRLETDQLQLLLGTKAAEVAEKTARILELEKHVESLTADLAAAEEDVTRWKEAATEEAAAGEAVLEEVEMRNKEIAALSKRLAEMKDFLEETNSRVGSKEDMALAAIAARTAAERSLQIADERGADLRYRIEEMSRQLEEFEQRSDNHGYGLLDMCWPWLCGRGRPGSRRSGHGQRSAEMGELLEPLV